MKTLATFWYSDPASFLSSPSYYSTLSFRSGEKKKRRIEVKPFVTLLVIVSIVRREPLARFHKYTHYSLTECRRGHYNVPLQVCRFLKCESFNFFPLSPACYFPYPLPFFLVFQSQITIIVFFLCPSSLAMSSTVQTEVALSDRRPSKKRKKRH